MTSSSDYTPPKVWTWETPSGGQFANINRPIAGATHEKELPVGKHPLQLYSLATPNGQKMTIMLEELLALGHAGAEYDAWLIRIDEAINSAAASSRSIRIRKIPALVDRSDPSRSACSNAARSSSIWRRNSAIPAHPSLAARTEMPELAVLADG